VRVPHESFDAATVDRHCCGLGLLIACCAGMNNKDLGVIFFAITADRTGGELKSRHTDMIQAAFFVFVVLIAVQGGAFAQAPPAQGGARDGAANPTKAPYPPFHIIGNIYYVGSAGLACYIIKTTKGLVLLDSGYPDMASQIEGNITALGFQLSDVKILINSHAHIDHGGGMGELKMATGAKLAAMAEDAPYFENGGHNDVLFGDRSLFPAVHVDRVIHDGDKVKLGDTTLTAHLTPGHTPGNTTWTMVVKDGGKSYNAVFFGIVTPFPNTALTRTPAYPNIAADWARTMKLLPTLPCEIFLASNGSSYNMAQKHDATLKNPETNPFIDPTGCKAYVERGEGTYQNLLKSPPPAASGTAPAAGPGPPAGGTK
jgi:metallo-beta-lactamase class B